MATLSGTQAELHSDVHVSVGRKKLLLVWSKMLHARAVACAGSCPIEPAVLFVYV